MRMETSSTPVGSGQAGPKNRRDRCVISLRPSARSSHHSQNRSPPAPRRASVLVEPRLICEIAYRGWTGDRLLRAAAFRGLRDDKSAEEIVLELPMRSKSHVSPTPVGVRLTHPERILWEEAGITKQGLADFYADIADWILPHVAGCAAPRARQPNAFSPSIHGKGWTRGSAASIPATKSRCSRSTMS